MAAHVKAKGLLGCTSPKLPFVIVLGYKIARMIGLDQGNRVLSIYGDLYCLEGVQRLNDKPRPVPPGPINLSEVRASRMRCGNEAKHYNE